MGFGLWTIPPDLPPCPIPTPFFFTHINITPSLQIRRSTYDDAATGSAPAPALGPKGPNKLDDERPLALPVVLPIPPAPALPTPTPLALPPEIVRLRSRSRPRLAALRSSYTRTPNATTIAPAPMRDESVSVWRACPKSVSERRTWVRLD